MNFWSLHVGLCTIIQVNLIVGEPKSGLDVAHETCINKSRWEVIYTYPRSNLIIEYLCDWTTSLRDDERRHGALFWVCLRCEFSELQGRRPGASNRVFWTCFWLVLEQTKGAGTSRSPEVSFKVIFVHICVWDLFYRWAADCCSKQ